MAGPTITGNLPFQAPNVSSAYNGTLGGIGSALQSGYNNAFAMNQAMYGNIMAGYQQTGAAQQAAFGGIQKGFKNLYGNVMSGIQGTDAAAQQQIKDLYAQQQGTANQGLINSGLGNSTVMSSVGRGLTADESKAQVNLANQMAQLKAGYQSSIGQAGLQSRMGMAEANTQEANQQLGFMNSISMPYPDASQYSQLAQMYGMNQQANRDRSMLGAGFGGGGAGPLGYTPGPTPGASYTGGAAAGMPQSGASLPQFFNPYSGSAAAGNIFGPGSGQASMPGYAGGFDNTGMDYGPTSGQPDYGPQPDVNSYYSPSAPSTADMSGYGSADMSQMYGEAG